MKREKLQFVAGGNQNDIFSSVDSVIRNISDLGKNFGNDNNQLLSIIFFINTQKEIFFQVRDYIVSIIEKNFTSFPTYSIIGQPPANGSDIQVEIDLIKDPDDSIKITYIAVEKGINCTRIETDLYIEYDIYGITVADEKILFDNRIHKSFEILDGFLLNHGLGMNDIIRQWNYIEDIVGFASPDCDSMQNYQILNNIRHEFYNKYQFLKGFPAATGIGMSMGGFVLDCIAVKEKADIEITPVKNPVQVCAYDYSEKVLIGSKTEKSIPKLSPKFERAKLYRSNVDYSLLISGTAAIHNEISLAKDDASIQTEITLDNIDKLIKVASEIIEKGGKKIKQITYPYLRVYIKNPIDYQSVKNICENHTHPINPVYLISDICRDELLVEIEGVISISII